MKTITFHEKEQSGFRFLYVERLTKKEEEEKKEKNKEADEQEG
jgi:hypothetical protein